MRKFSPQQLLDNFVAMKISNFINNFISKYYT